MHSAQTTINSSKYQCNPPVPVAARFKAPVCGRSLTGNGGSNSAGGMDVCLNVCYQEEASASGCSLVQRSNTECGMFECDREASIKRRPWLTRGC